jgi:hypothetical protein
VQVRIRVAADIGGPDVRDLYRWLVQDPDVRARISLVEDGGRPDALGGLEVVNVVVSNLVGLGNLLVAVAMWRSARARGTETRVERNGRSFRVDNADPETIRRLQQALAESSDLAEPDDPGIQRPESQR